MRAAQRKGYFTALSVCAVVSLFIIKLKSPTAFYQVINTLQYIQTGWTLNRVQDNITLPSVYTFLNKHWELANVCKSYKTYKNRSDFQLVRFATEAGVTKLFIHSPSVDGISSIIKRYGAFEVATINRILHELKKDDRLNFIDIGANVGQHSIAASLIGRHALALDCAKPNIEHLCATVQYLNMTSNISMIYSLISDSNEKRQVRYSPKNNHFGNVYVELDGIGSKMLSIYKKGFFSNTTVEQNAMSLDDLLTFPNIQRFKRVFIKMDVEGHEHRVLKGGKEFFQDTFISGIMMEWAWHKKRETAKSIISFMKDNNFVPYEMSKNKQGKDKDISGRDPDQWPQDVLWLPVR